MEVTFSILLGGDLLDERQIAARIDALRPRLQDLDATEGLLSLYNSMGSFKLTSFRDALAPLINAFCFEAVADLAAGKDVTLSLVSHEETAQLKVEGEEVVVSGTDVEEDRCPTGPLLEALTDCGERFVRLLKLLHGKEPAWEARLAGWDRVVAATRASIT